MQPIEAQTVRQKLVEAIQAVARRETDPKARIEVDSNDGFRLVGAPKYHDSLPGYVRDSRVRSGIGAWAKNGGRNGKVCVRVTGRNYATIYTKTCTDWTPERINEAATIIWHEYLRSEEAEAKMEAEKKSRNANQPIADRLNREFSLPGVSVAFDEGGFHLEGTLTADEAGRVLKALSEMRRRF